MEILVMIKYLSDIENHKKAEPSKYMRTDSRLLKDPGTHNNLAGYRTYMFAESHTGRIRIEY